MERRDFLTVAGCSLGMCCCTGAATTQPAQPSDNPQVRELRQKVDFMQKSMARLVAALDEPTRKRVLETMGRECAKASQREREKFKGKPAEFVAALRRQWIEESSEYDEQTGRMRIVGKPSPCPCAFVRVGLTPPEFCQCSVGWLKEVYSDILGRPVDAEIESSTLRGGRQCISRIQPSQTG